MMTAPSLVCVNDYETKAVELLGKTAADYYATGADDEQTVKNNVKDFKR